MKRTITIVVLAFLTTACTDSVGEWIPMHIKQHGFSFEILQSDLPIPDYTQSGKAKFIKTSEGITLGYQIEFQVDPLDMSKVPQKYLESTEMVVDGVELTKLPTHFVAFDIDMQFALKDKDGFVIGQFTSPEYTLKSGKDGIKNIITIQDTHGNFTQLDAYRTKSVEVKISEVRCANCDND